MDKLPLNLSCLVEQSTHLFIRLSPCLQDGKRAIHFLEVAKMHVTGINDLIMSNNVSYYNMFKLMSTFTQP